MNLKEWLSGLEYKLIQGEIEIDVEDVIYDSRKAKPGVVFVCMKGTKIDSHDFIADVVNQGVRVLVIEKEITDLPAGVTVISVLHAREALALLSSARFDHPVKKMISIGVTGTKGKTTTTYMIKAILEAAGKKVGLIGTAGAVIGDTTYPTMNTTPESYQLQEYFARMVEEGCEYMIMEVSSQGIKMHRIDGIRFDYGIFTNISNDHIGPDEHEDFQEYLYYKSQLLDRCKIGLVNKDEENYDEIIRQATCELYNFSLRENADFEAEHIEYVSDPDFVGLAFQVSGRYEQNVKVNIPGKFNVYNALAAIAVCSFLDLPKDKTLHALEHLSINGRMEIVYTSARCTVIVDYAHNAISMESLLSTLRDYNPKRLVCVFGCGGNRSKDRRYAMGEIAGMMADLSILTADNSRYEKVEDILADIRGSIEPTGGSYLEIPDRREAIAYSILHAEPGDMIAVIGKGHEDYQEIEGVRYPFLDRRVIEEIVSTLED
ncbi:MAG: UDP-N-acetylmuramoyl-L-alanyl-D-glutamate--2,6-diaminopimelate ligase [Hungatella sp.]